MIVKKSYVVSNSSIHAIVVEIKGQVVDQMVLEMSLLMSSN